MYHIILCDDTQKDLDRMEALILSSKEYETDMQIEKYHSGIDYLEDKTEAADLIILDMQMQGVDGYETAREIRQGNEHVVIVFCSSVIMPAPEHFTVQPYRYLLKYDKEEALQQMVADILIEMKRRGRKVMVEAMADGKAAKIDANDILYVNKIKRGLDIHLSRQSALYDTIGDLTARTHMEEYEKTLCDEGFARPHMSYLVNLKRIRAVEGMEIIMENGERLPISRSLKDAFHARFSSYFGSKYRRERK